MLASTNVYDAQNLAAVAHLSAIESSVPFLHFFDGFRTSHEINTIESISDVDLLKLIDFDKVRVFKNRALNTGCNYQRGLAENEDIYFQSVEARNNDYNNVPNIVNDYMQKINDICGTNYQPFNYYGATDAANIIIAMGSVCDTVKIVIDKLNSLGHKCGLIEVHLYRPFSADYLKQVLPSTAKNIAVLDRTKNHGSIGEPLYLDVLSALKDMPLNIVGGRYGLASKNTTPNDVASVYEMLENKLINNFTIGIVDDITNLSLPINKNDFSINAKEILIYGYGSDGMVSTSKDIMKIMGNNTNNFVQGYFQYDSKKSGGVTVSNLRISDSKINAPYYVTSPELVVITKDSYLNHFEMLNNIKENGTILINSEKDPNALLNLITDEDKEIIHNKHLRFLIINASEIADNCNIKGKISKIMEIVILKLLKYDDALDVITASIKKQFANKGEDIVNNNIKAVNESLNKVHIINSKLLNNNQHRVVNNSIFEEINNRLGETLPVSKLLPFKNGVFPCSLSKIEKRSVSTLVPKWDKEKCIQCGLCSMVCPHAVIRPFAVKDKEKGIPLLGNKDYDFRIVVDEADCTGCGLCISACLGKGGNKALSFGPISLDKVSDVDDLFNNYQNPEIMDRFTIKGSQFKQPKFEFSGACAGCGETPYIKLLTQLFGDKLVIANATGCSSIYGGSVPSTPYSIPWANSLFEDNAEFGYGLKLTYNKMHERIKPIIKSSYDSVDDKVKSLYDEWLNNEDDYKITNETKTKLLTEDIPVDLFNIINYMPPRCVWIIGGEGWAYNIGFVGIDHVLSSGEDVNILVLDTEVYSNTGGQASKSTRVGAVAKFASAGKKAAKKDLLKIALTYPHVYVGAISIGANPQQAIKVLKEAEKYDGPSIIVAYAPCIAQGIIKGMKNSLNEEKEATSSGYFPIFHFNPETKEFKVDSKADFSKYYEFICGENRYRSLKGINKNYKDLLEENRKNA